MKYSSYLKQIIFLLIITPIIKPAVGITYQGNLQLGDNIAEICLAKILSLKYNIPFLYYPRTHTDLFVFHDTEQRLEKNPNIKRIRVATEKDIINNKPNNVLFWTSILTKIDYIDPAWITEVKKILQLREIPIVNDIPDNVITIAVHIRKGNGGGQYYDGEQKSQQLFEFDRSRITYLTNYNNYAFDWSTYTRPILKSPTNPHNVPVDSIKDWETKFPPDQYYVDQIKKISSDLQNPPLYVQIFTDDKDPKKLTNLIENAVNLPNITFHYEDNQNKSFKERMAEDLYCMSRFDILIRSQSYFPRIAELMGDHKVIIYPLNSSWTGNKLIMNTIVIKGSIQNLLTSI